MSLLTDVLAYMLCGLSAIVDHGEHMRGWCGTRCHESDRSTTRQCLSRTRKTVSERHRTYETNAILLHRSRVTLL
jgi:hypothetical protein